MNPVPGHALLVLTLAGCPAEEPVVKAVVSPKTAEEVQARREAAEGRTRPEHIDATYQKVEGVYIDARYFGGRNYAAIRGEIEAQLGAVAEERDLGDQGREVRFERGTLRVVGELITMIEVPLPENLRRTEALGVLGFPPAISWAEQQPTNEFRLQRQFGFRRIIFHRIQPGSELVDRVTAWHRSPGDR